MNDRKLDAIMPTLGDLRRELATEIPPPGAELAFDLAESGAPGYLPDCIVVSAELMDGTLRGAFDHLPDSTPLEELSL